MKDGIIDLLSGTAGGIACVYSGQPLDTVKVKMQAFPDLYGNWVKCCRDTWKMDGIRGLYAGTIPALAANVAENAVLFAAYGYCQKLVSYGRDKEVKSMSPVENAVSGSMAAVFAALVLCPTELVKVKLQSQRETLGKSAHCTPFSVCRDMYRTGGIRSFMVGMTPTLAREVPGYFFFFGSYETCRYFFTPKDKTKDDIGAVKTAISGGVGGMALWTMIFPADVVKSRMQISGKGTLLGSLMTIAREEGIRALYKGLTPTIIRSGLASAFLFVVYENTRRILHSMT
ncbi:mitochondrial carrier protein [Ditylenchus destructor]|nr:mitochondrial carrier protein [Ditylenchus destructor]